MIQIDFKCLVEDQILCDKVQKAFDGASKIISNTLKLKETIIINATFFDFCKGQSDLSCPIEVRKIIGATAPNRFYSLKSDDDKLERIYPQALVKQFQFPEHPKYDDYDVSTQFNARVPFYFDDDIIPINPLQYDFQYIVTHELLHGLGFYTLWRPYQDPLAPKGLMPPLVVIDSGNDGNIEPKTFNEPETVKESIFDKFMIRLDNGTFTSEYSKQIGQYFLDNENVTILNEVEFEQTYQFQLMKEMLGLATTPKSLGFLPHDSVNYATDAVILETTLPEFQSGSSLSHVDLLTYNNTKEFLMVYKGTPGRTLNDFVAIGGNYPGGVIGPKIKSILESIGYATEDYPNPKKPNPFVNPKSNSAIPISNSIIFNQFYIMIFIIIILL
ncbi:hypothetical protein C1645_772847 [Glomus cerebriforme]|uniref:Sequence orphan n=1 Tax=Glomus cerebriforme TaxID=658196 RepID=A0A397T272_9GLOM|nr:hypothetical protein C1645_772847 [Glomus cerebriforme]